MNSLLDSDRDEDVDDRHSRSSYRGSGGGSYGKDREITLGTTMVLAIFFALAVFGAVFFGFGYSMGAKHAAATTGMAVGSGSSASFSTFKPAPGSPVGAPAARPGTPDQTTAAFVTPTPVATLIPAKPVAVKPVMAEAQPVDTSVVLPAPAPKPAVKAPAAAPVATPSTQIVGEFMVQVAASSHEEDAETVVSALKRRGYNVAIHTEPQDKFFHVQIGPFANKADAVAMSKKVAADGFNAIVK